MSNMFNGVKSPNSAMKMKTDKNCKDINTLAKKDGTSAYTVALKVLSMSRDELERYIRSKGEVPVRQMNGIIVQASLLRMEDISVISRAANMSEADAEAHIQEAETDAMTTNNSAKQSILQPSVQAALKVCYCKLVSMVNSSAGTTGISDSLDLIRQFGATPLTHNVPVRSDNMSANYMTKYNNADDDGDTSEDEDGTDGSSGSVIFSGPISGSVSGVFTPTTNNPDDSSSSVGDLFSNIANNASSIAKAAGSLLTTTNSISKTINSVGSNIGSSAIDQYLSANWWKILLIVIVIAVIIILLSRGTKN